MFNVVIGMETVDQKETLAAACQDFVRRIQEMIQAGCASRQIIFEACWITAAYDGVEGMMNFPSVREFANRAGIVREGKLVDKPLPYIPPRYEREIFIAFSNEGFDAWMKEHEGLLESLMAEPPQTEPKPATLILP